MENELLQTLLETVIVVFVPILASILAAYLKKTLDQAKQKLTDQQYIFISNVLSDFVRAAEQTGLKDELLKEGSAKKEWVLNESAAYLESKGIKIDVKELSVLIENAVLDNFNWGKLSGHSEIGFTTTRLK